MGSAPGEGGDAVQLRRGFGAQDQRQRGAGVQAGGERAGVEVVLDGVEPAIGFYAQEEIVVPVVPDRGLGAVAEQVDRRGPLERRHPQPLIDRIDLHLPIAGVGAAVVVAVIDERLERQRERRGGPAQVVADVGGVGVLFHPDPLFQQGVGAGIGPHRRRAVELEAVEVDEALRVGDAAGPSVGREGIGASVVRRGLVELGDEERASERRFESSHEQAVVATCQQPGHGARGEAAEAVRHQPFAPAGDGFITAQVAA